jgi:hypothetical protein
MLQTMPPGAEASTNPPRVSFIMACYNAADTLEQAVQSIQRQTIKDWEAIIVDDGSTDGSLAVAQKLATADARIRVVSQANEGAAKARNFGIGMARGEWIMFHDADDWTAPNFLERLLALAASDPAVGVVSCATDIVDDGQTLLKRLPAFDLSDPFPVFVRTCAVTSIATLVKRRHVAALGGFDETLQTCEDWDLWQRMARSGIGFATTPEPLSFYRCRPGSLSRRIDAMIRDGVTVIGRGFEADPRISGDQARFPQGLRSDEARDMKAHCTIYNAAVGAGIGQPSEPLIALAPALDGWTVDAAAWGPIIADAAAYGRAESPSALGLNWQVMGPRFEQLIDALAARTGASRQIDLLRAHIEAYVRSNAAFLERREMGVASGRTLDLTAPETPIPVQNGQVAVIAVHEGENRICVLETPVLGPLDAPTLAGELAYRMRSMPLREALRVFSPHKGLHFWLDLARHGLRPSNLGVLLAKLKWPLAKLYLATALRRALKDHVYRRLTGTARPRAPMPRLDSAPYCGLVTYLHPAAAPTEERLSAQQIGAQLDALANVSATAIPMSQWIAAAMQGGYAPPRALVICMDGESWGPDDPVWAALETRGLHAAIFVDPGLIAAGKSTWSWPALRQKMAQGHELGWRPQALLGRMTVPELYTHIAAAHAAFQEFSRGPAQCVMFNVGDTERVAGTLARWAGFEAAITPDHGLAPLDGDAFAMPRVPVFPGDPPGALLDRLKRLLSP